MCIRFLAKSKCICSYNYDAVLDLSYQKLENGVWFYMKTFFSSYAVNLPPTLSKSQVSSVRKSLKLQMLSLLKHPAAVDMISQIATLLTDLGATQSEVNKAMPKPSELAASRKRKAAEFEKEKQRAKKLAKDEVCTHRVHYLRVQWWNNSSSITVTIHLYTDDSCS